MKAFTVFLGVTTLALLPVHADKPVRMDSGEAVTWLAETRDVQVLDVRTKEEFAEGHLKGAKLIPWTDKDFTARADAELDKGKPLFVYCRSGRRSAEAVKALEKAGFKDIRHLQGGILAWRKAGKPVVQPD